MRRDASKGAAARITAAIFGSLALALAASIGIARAAPLPAGARFAIAHYAFLPFWITAACIGFTAKSGARAWAAYAALTLLFLVLARWGGHL